MRSSQISRLKNFSDSIIPELVNEDANKVPLDEYASLEYLNIKNRINQQNSLVASATDLSVQEQFNLNQSLQLELSRLEKAVNSLQSIQPPKKENPLEVGLTKKIMEFNRIIEGNIEEVKKNKEQIQDILRKKRENEDFFKKFYGEKKVWLDRLKEFPFREVAHDQKFKYGYEAKTMKMLLEGVMLEKVQDEVEKRGAIEGDNFGWVVMDEHKFSEQRKIDEFELNKELLNFGDDKEANQKEYEARVQWERNDLQNQASREQIHMEWQQLWSEIWIPGVPPSDDATLTTRRNLVKDVTGTVAFEMFKNGYYDVWKFKNMINSTEEFVVLDKVRKYFPEHINKSISKDEEILNNMMIMIENIKQEEEVIYMNLKPAESKLMEYETSTNEKHNSNTSIEKLRDGISRIKDVKAILKNDSSAGVKFEVEGIAKSIKKLQDDNEKKLFTDNGKDEERLYDIFLPLTNLLMVCSFISIGKKRNKGYDNRIEKLMVDNTEKEAQNKEIEGKKILLNDITEKIKNEKVFEVNTPGYEGDLARESNNIRDSKEQIINNFNVGKDSLVNIQNEQKKYFNEVKGLLVQPILEER